MVCIFLYESQIYNHNNQSFPDKSSPVLQKAHIKILSRTIYNYWFFSCTYTLFFCWKIESCCHCCSPQQIRPQINVQLVLVITCMFGRVIWDKLPKCIFENFKISKNHKSDLSQKLSKPNMWLLVNLTKPSIYIYIYIYIWDYSSIRIIFNMLNKCHTLSIVYTMLV